MKAFKQKGGHIVIDSDGLIMYKKGGPSCRYDGTLGYDEPSLEFIPIDLFKEIIRSFSDEEIAEMRKLEEREVF